MKKNHQLKCAHNSDDANTGYNASEDYGGLFASGGDHFGFFPVQNEHDATDAIRVKVFFVLRHFFQNLKSITCLTYVRLSGRHKIKVF